MQRIVIAGCGYVGNALAERLFQQSHEVFGIRRDASRLARGITAIAGDLAHPASLGPAPPNVDFAVFAAAADAGTEAAYRRAYVDGMSGFLSWLGSTGTPPRRVVMTSSSSVYGQSRGEVVDETSATEPTGFRGSIMLEAERLLTASAFPSVIARLGGIYGPGRARLIQQARDGRLQVQPTPHYTNRIHRDDAAGVLQHLLKLREPAPVYLAVDDEPADEARFYEWLARQLGAPAPTRASDAGAGRGGKRCNNALLRRSGYVFRYPTFREGYGALIDSLDS